jgi:hypothetical protein
MQANNRLALITYQVCLGDPDSPPIACSHANDLIRSVNGIGSTDARNCFHILQGFKQFHTNRGGSKSQQTIQSINQVLEIEMGII